VSKPTKLHPKNPANSRYPIARLCELHPDLTPFVIVNPKGEQSIDFSQAKAVTALNAALLKHYYGVKNWFLPEGYLCPPVPGRADYLYHLADLLSEANKQQIPTGKQVRLLDVGTGANCIYPLIGHAAFNWRFTASEIDTNALKIAQLNVDANKGFNKAISLQRQNRHNRYFKGIIKPHVPLVATLCNPPFYASAAEAEAANAQKNQNLGIQTSDRNFGGTDSELWCEGGEFKFIHQMVKESQQYPESVCWFTSLLANKDYIEPLMDEIEKVGAAQARVVDMGQGQKQSRFIAWSFLTEQEQYEWLQALLEG